MKLNYETKVGLLAAISITLLILGFNFLKGNRIFQEDFELISYYDNIDGLSVGNPVTLNGLDVGQVKDIDLNKNTGKIKVVYNLEKGLQVPTDSRAMIASADLLGSKEMRIILGDSPAMAESGSIIQDSVAQSLSDRVAEEILPLKDDLLELIREMNEVMAWMNEVLDESNGNKIDEMIDNFKITSQNVASATYKIDTTMSSVQYTVGKAQLIVTDLQKNTEKVNDIINNTKTFTDTLASSSGTIKNMIIKTDSTIAEMEAILSKIESGEGTLGKLVNDTLFYKTITGTTARVDSFLNKFSEDPTIYMHHTFNIFGKDKKRK